MSSLMEKVESGANLSIEEWKLAMTLFRATLVLIIEPPYQVNKDDALEFIALVLRWAVVNARLEKRATELRIGSVENEDWDAVDDLLATLKGAAAACCDIFRQTEFDDQLQHRLVDLGLVAE